MANQEELDKSSLLSLFPLELWTQILHLPEPRSFNPVADSTPFLKLLLEPLKTRLLFSSVVEILFFWRYLTKTHLMLTRRVCRAWKKAVDFGFSNWKLDRDHCFYRLSFQVGVIPPGHNFPDSNKLIKFVKHFNSSDNPFFTRSVTITFPWNSTLLPTFYEALLTFLQKFGHHIHYCYMNAAVLWKQQRFFRQLDDMLKLMPNLRRLQFSSRIIHNATMSGLEGRLVKENPPFGMPKLKHLVQSGQPVTVIRELVHNNQQISVVQSDCQTFQHVQIYLEEMPNLEALAIGIHNVEEYITFRDSQVNCRLKTLNIHMGYMEMEWTDVFTTLSHHFSGTLQELCICLPLCKNVCKSLNHAEGLILPKLKKLSIIMAEPSSLDFILPTRNHLEEFSILVNEFNDSSTVDGTIRFFQCADLMYQSIIWSLFSKLNKIHVKLGYSPVFEGNRFSWRQVTQNTSS